MAAASAYNIKRPASPVPIARRAVVTRECASRYWSMFTRYYGEDQFKWFDVDLALAESADVLERIARLAELTSDQYVLDLIERAIEKHSPADHPVEASA